MILFILLEITKKRVRIDILFSRNRTPFNEKMNLYDIYKPLFYVLMDAFLHIKSIKPTPNIGKTYF